MEDVVIPKLDLSKGKELAMEQVLTPRSPENILSSGDQPILNTSKEVTNLNLITYNIIKQSIVKQTLINY